MFRHISPVLSSAAVGVGTALKGAHGERLCGDGSEDVFDGDHQAQVERKESWPEYVGRAPGVAGPQSPCTPYAENALLEFPFDRESNVARLMVGTLPNTKSIGITPGPLRGFFDNVIDRTSSMTDREIRETARPLIRAWHKALAEYNKSAVSVEEKIENLREKLQEDLENATAEEDSDCRFEGILLDPSAHPGMRGVYEGTPPSKWMQDWNRWKRFTFKKAIVDNHSGANVNALTWIRALKDDERVIAELLAHGLTDQWRTVYAFGDLCEKALELRQGSESERLETLAALRLAGTRHRLVKKAKDEIAELIKGQVDRRFRLGKMWLEFAWLKDILDERGDTSAVAGFHVEGKGDVATDGHVTGALKYRVGQGGAELEEAGTEVEGTTGDVPALVAGLGQSFGVTAECWSRVWTCSCVECILSVAAQPADGVMASRRPA